MKLFLKLFLLISPLLVLYALLLMGLSFYQDMLIFPGHKITKTPKKYQSNELLLPVDKGVMLHGWLLNPDQDNLLIYFGGNTENISQNLRFFNKLTDYTVVMFHYRGYGKSQGTPSQKMIYKDALHLYDLMIERKSRKKVILFGRSLGSGVATYLGSNRKTDGIILSTPFDSITNVAQNKFPFVPIWLLITHPFNSIEFAKKLTVPVLMLIAKNDQVIPYKHSKRLKNAIKHHQWIEIPHRGHGDLDQEAVYQNTIKKFLKNN